LQLPFLHSPAHDGFWPAHSTWHGPAAQSKSHELPLSQRQVPFAQVPVQSVAGSQLTWHGGLWQVNRQTLCGPQWQSPLPHCPTHDGLSRAQSMWHGGAKHGSWQLSPGAQTHSPL